MNNLSPLEREILSGKPVVTLTYGDSMEPLLYNKSTRVVIVKTTGSLKKYDLPVYKRDTGQFVMHRIIKADNEFYYTRGDNRTGLEKVPKQWVLGVVTEIYRKDKHIFVTDIKYKAYVYFWTFSYPARCVLKKVRRLLKRGSNV